MKKNQVFIENRRLKKEDLQAITYTGDTPLIESKKHIASYKVPISVCNTKNLNEHIYPESVWQKCIERGDGDGAYGLCDHPEDGDGSVKDIFCIWKNIHIENFNNQRVVFADCILIGKWGQHAEDLLNAGGTLGFSSYGFGDLEDDDITIAENFYIERPADWVLYPASLVYMDKKIENIEKKETIKSEEGKTMKLEEKNFIIQIENKFSEAAKLEDEFKKESAFSDILDFFEDIEHTDSIKKLYETIQDSHKSVKESLGANYEKYRSQILKAEQKNNDLKKANEGIVDLVEKVREEALDWKDRFEESKQKMKFMFSASDIARERHDTLAQFSGITAENDAFFKKTQILEGNLKKSKKENQDLSRKIQDLKNKLEESHEDIYTAKSEKIDIREIANHKSKNSNKINKSRPIQIEHY